MENVSSLLDQVNTVFLEKQQQLKQAEATLEQEVAALAKEKEMMTKVLTADNDIIYLNVGGTFLATKRSTLTQAAGSTLAAWFSGRWEDCLDRDDQGRTFLDFDPDLFKHILSFLRSCAICSNADARPSLEGVDATKQKAFTDLVKFLALEDYLGYTYDTALQPQLFTFAKASAEVTVSDDRRTATFSKYSRGHPSILVEPVCSRCCYAKLKINSLGSRLFIGVGTNFDVSKGLEQFGTCTTYGWSFGHGELFSISKGKNTRTSEIFNTGCWVLVKADFTSQKLSMRTSSNSSFDMLLEVADDVLSKYTFVVILLTYKDEVELLPVTPQDKILLP